MYPLTPDNSISWEDELSMIIDGYDNEENLEQCFVTADEIINFQSKRFDYPKNVYTR